MVSLRGIYCYCISIEYIFLALMVHVFGIQPPSVKKTPERRLTNEIRLPNGRFGSKVSREISEEKQEDAYQLQWSQQLVQNLSPPAKAAKYDLGSDDSTDHACHHRLLVLVSYSFLFLHFKSRQHYLLSLIQIRRKKLVFLMQKHGEISGEYFWTARKAMPRCCELCSRCGMSYSDTNEEFLYSCVIKYTSTETSQGSLIELLSSKKVLRIN